MHGKVAADRAEGLSATQSTRPGEYLEQVTLCVEGAQGQITSCVRAHGAFVDVLERRRIALNSRPAFSQPDIPSRVVSSLASRRREIGTCVTGVGCGWRDTKYETMRSRRRFGFDQSPNYPHRATSRDCPEIDGFSSAPCGSQRVCELHTHLIEHVRSSSAKTPSSLARRSRHPARRRLACGAAANVGRDFVDPPIREGRMRSAAIGTSS